MLFLPNEANPSRRISTPWSISRLGYRIDGIFVAALGGVDEHAMPAPGHLKGDIRHVLPDARRVGDEGLADDEERFGRRVFMTDMQKS